MLSSKEVFDLAQELLDRMDIAIKEAEGLKVNECDKVFPFVHIGDNEYVNPKYLSFDDHFKIVQLCKFVRKNKELGSEDLNSILSMNESRFGVLLDVNKVIPNLVDEIRVHDDEKYISYMYFGLRQSKVKEKLKDNSVSI